MSRNQIILLFLLSIFFGLAAVFVARQWMARQIQPQTEVEVVEREPVIVAALEIPAGVVIEEQHITQKLLEKDWRGENQYIDSSELIGKVAHSTIYPGEILIKQQISSKGEGATLAVLIPEDKRAVTIRVNDVIGVAGFLLPGNRVDVLGTVKYGKNSASTATVLKDIRVLAVDQTARTSENKPVIVRAVTLEVEPSQAEKLLTAQTRGDIHLTLRNPQALKKEKKAVRRYAPSVTIIKGTETSKVKVRD
ncbi:Flp pilus assembly protein CpaB [Vibrio quintilis]|uniref:SAF domain protein n=1 Tax=Vibrio quintilis TaxID=1117707 RepID=A0A1M7YS73_9VIBR|nr:Flp pilus assembly protein CpaB [Vibrio quintilis]SHO55469.1 SAF domain protein [Vibrio quintilis]